jgi:hypothetical protein
MNDNPMSRKLLAAAADLPAPFSHEALIVRAFEMWPDDFCLKNFKGYPDSNKVATLLMGERGLVRRGHLEKVRPKTYTVSALGRQKLADKKAGALTSPRVPAALARCISGLLESKAFLRWLGGMVSTLTVQDARGFMALDPVEAVEEGFGCLVNHQLALPGGRFVSARELDQIDRCRDALQKAFGRKLERKAVPA